MTASLRRATILCLFGVLMNSAGCIWARQRINTVSLPQRIAGVVKGQTTQAELEEMIGSPPTSILGLGANSNRVLIWSYGDAKTHGFNLLIFGISKTNVGLDSAIFLLDSEGVVREYSIGNNSRDLPWQWWAFGDA